MGRLGRNDLKKRDGSLSVGFSHDMQDPLGKQGVALRQEKPGDPVFKDGWAAWAKPLTGGDVALLVINTASVSLSASFDAAQLGLPSGTGVSSTDLWTNVTDAKTSRSASGWPLKLKLNATDGFAMLRLHTTQG